MCECNNNCGCVEKEIITKTGKAGPQGNTGLQGNKGDQGPIGPQGPEGAPGELQPLIWIEMVLLNSWATLVSDPASYAFRDGVIYFRGFLISSGITSTVFANIDFVGQTVDIPSTIAQTTVVPSIYHPFLISEASNDLEVIGSLSAQANWLLRTVAPISVV